MRTNPLHRLIILLLISILLVSCGSSDNSTQVTGGAGISFQLKWPVAKTVGSTPVGVATVRMSVSGPGMITISQDFAASAGTGSIANVPVGVGRTITFLGLDSIGGIMFLAEKTNVELKPGETYDCGDVKMLIAPAATVTASMNTFTGVNKVRMSVSGPGMTTMVKDFATAAGIISMAYVPEGSGRTITFQGLSLDPSPAVISEAVIYNAILVAGQTYDCGLVTMNNSVPAAPTTLTPSVVSASQINLSWVDNANNETGYRIERKTEGGAFSQLAVLTANVSSYNDTSCSPLTTYSYRVTATNGIGSSVFSDVASATSMELTYSISGMVTSGGVALPEVIILLSGDVSASTKTDSAGNYTFTGYRNGSYQLSASLTGYDISNPISAPVNGANVSGKNFTATASTVPAAPTSLNAKVLSDTQISLSWTRNAINETNYLIERSLTGADGSYVQIATTIASAASYVDSKLSPSTAYYYRVRAVNSVGYSAYILVAPVTTLAAASFITPELILVPAGTYTMGNGTSAKVEAFYIGKYEVTQREWNTVMPDTPRNTSCGLDCPVESVSWDDVQKFISKLNQLSGKNYRLPHEAEWEYAARWGGFDLKYSGSSNVDAVAWYLDNSGGATHKVGLKLPNGLGVYDMSGNVMEWTEDAYDSLSYILKGGSWGGTETTQSTTYRFFHSPSAYDLYNKYFGFRLAIPNP